MKKAALWTALFTLFLLLPLTSAEAGEDPAVPALPVRAVVLYDGDEDPEAMADALSAMEGVELLWRYDSLFSGAAVEAGPADLRAIEALDGVAGVSRVRSYQPASGGGEEEPVWPDAGLALMGAEALEQGLTGDGVVIAVLDNGFNTAHEAFSDASLTLSPAIRREDAAAYAARKGTNGRYISARIPFAYDYYNRDSDVSTTSGHGTHVAALAAGYVRDGNGRVLFRGAAPGAQLLCMKIFPDDPGGGADDAVILRALEDAWNLGAGVINISVGTGPGFYQDGVLDGAYSRAFALLEAEGVIVCCSAGNEGSPSAYKTWTRPLPSGAYTDYGAVTSPASCRGTLAIAAAGEADGQAVMAEYSAWGPASGLHMAPTLTAFGGPVISAGATGQDVYYSDCGTSMASGCASGIFAVTLQALRQQGITDRKEAARLARDLLASTAQVLTDGEGVPLSPRKQGAGLIDLRAALSSGLVVREPLAELGASGEGRFTMTFTLENLSGAPAELSLHTQVLTDAWLEDGGTYYSRMSPMDISGGVTVSGPASISVPAGGKKEITLELTVSSRLRQELARIYPNGFYVEGFIAASGSGNAQSVHGTFLGYCGSWEAAPVMEALDFRDVQDEVFRLAGELHSPAEDDPLQIPEPSLSGLQAELGANLAYLPAKGTADIWYGRLLGANGHAAALHDEARFAIPGQDTDAMHSLDRRLGLALYTLRCAAGVAVIVSDPDTGEIYYASAAAWVGKSAMDPAAARIGPGASFFWDGTDAGGAALPGGTRAQVSVYAWLDGGSAIQDAFDRRVRLRDPESFRWLLEEAYDPWRTMEFPVTIDSAAPTAVSATIEDGLTLSVTLRDDQYLSYASVRDEAGTLLAAETFFPEQAGETCTLTVDLSPSGKRPDTLYITAEDYASNTAGYALDLSALLDGGSPGFRRTAYGLLRDADPSAWYWEAVDYAVSGGLMACDRACNFQPGLSAARSDVVCALYRASGAPPSGLTVSDLPFTDLAGPPYVLDALCWAYETGLVSGRGGGSFDGSAGVTRQELAVMLFRCAGRGGGAAPAGDLAAFPDAGSVSDWAMEGTAWAVGQGLLQGRDGKLDPRANVTRAETAQILQRFLEG